MYRAKMIKVDTAGAIQWNWLSDINKRTNWIRDIIKTPDGGYIYCGEGDGFEVLDASGQIGIQRFRGWVERLDSSRVSLWHKAYGKVYENTLFVNVKEQPDGTLRLFGTEYLPVRTDSVRNLWDTHNKGWFMKLSATGDSLLQRTYSGIISCDDDNEFYDAKQTADGGFIMVGESTDRCSGFVQPIQRGWLVKVDSNGCLGGGNDPQCWPLAVSPVHINNEYKVYPNPVTGLLNINVPQHKDMAVLSITDITGRQLLSQSLSFSKDAVDLSGFMSGVYLYRILEDGLVVQQGKLLKQ